MQKIAQYLKSLKLEEKETCVSEGRKYKTHIYSSHCSSWLWHQQNVRIRENGNEDAI